MNRPTRPEIEIRDALDREVLRVFDPARLAAGIEQRRLRAAQGPPLRETGPLSRIPPLVQWVGVVAAVIAALTGLRSLVLELTAPGTAPVLVERAVVDAVPQVERPAPIGADAVERQRPRPAIEPRVQTTPEMEPESQRPAPRVEPETRATAAQPDVAAAPPAPTDRMQGSPPTSATQPVVTLPGIARSEAHAPPAVPDRAPATTPTTLQPIQSTFPGYAEQIVRGVRVTSLRLGNVEDLTADLVDLPELDATLIAIRGRGAPRVSTHGRRGNRPVAAAVEEGRQDGPLYLRVLVGAVEGNGPATQHVLFGTDLKLVPLEELGRIADPWLDHEQVLKQRFELSSIVSLDAVRIGPREDSRSFVALAGDRRYDVRVTRNLLEHGIDLVIAGREDRDSINATISIENDRLAILAVPEGRLRGSVTPHDGDMLFVTLSAWSPATAELVAGFERSTIVDDPEQPAILLSDVGPHFELTNDEDAEVRLRALVGRNGVVSAIEILEHPGSESEELLAAFAAGAVRKWRYLPARHLGLEVATWLEVALISR